jgi:hypothetical protein
MALRPTIAILARRGDLAAVALACTLHRRRRCRVAWADEYDLVRARVVHRPSSGLVDGRTVAATALAGDVVQLPDGSRITPETDVVLCRIAALPAAVQTDPRRQAYADAEAFALGLSWLTGLGDAVPNRPSPFGLAGLEPDLMSLVRLAAVAGLATPRLQLTSNAAGCPVDPALRSLEWPVIGLPRAYVPPAEAATAPPLPRPLAAGEPVRLVSSALVIGGDVVGAPRVLHDRLVALARAAGLAVCEVGLGHADSTAEPVVTGLSAVPRLTGPGQLEALAGYLERRGDDRAGRWSAA